MQIERVIVGVKTLGPGNRLAIWVNGCHRRCPGCVSPRLRRFRVDHERDVKQLLGMLDLSGVDGVTVSGGEPFEQPDGIVEIAEFCKGRGIDDILVYSGYTLEQLRARRDKSTDDALAAISVLITAFPIMGPPLMTFPVSSGMPPAASINLEIGVPMRQR